MVPMPPNMPPYMRWMMLVVGVLGFLALVASQQGDGPTQPTNKGAPSDIRVKSDVRFKVERVARGLDHPWGLAFLPDGRMLVTERDRGTLRMVAAGGGRPSAPLAGVPEIDPRGQGGLLDVAVHPDFSSNRLVYLSYSGPVRGQGNSTAVCRGRLNADATGLEDCTVIFRQNPIVRSGYHFGSRLVFDGAGHLFITTGDRYGLADEAQNPGNHVGKLIRIRDDGSIPPDNPHATTSDWAPEVWSIGHRNVQGAALHPKLGVVYTVEHGARGGDEINRPEKGRNYGWPVITYGIDYSGRSIGIGTAKEGMEQPLYYWDPSIAPSGMTFYTGDAFPAWKGDMFVGALAGEALVRVAMDEAGNPAGEERLLTDRGSRIRDVRTGPDGAIYLLDDSDGEIIRLVPR